MNTSRQSGLNLIELLLVLVVVAGIAVIAFLTYSKVQVGQAATNETQILAGAQAGMKGLFPMGSYTGLTSAIAVSADVFPQTMETATGTLVNQWNGAVEVYGTDLNDGTATAAVAAGRAPFIQVSYAAVPAKVCQKLGAAASANWGAVYVEGVAVLNKLDDDDTNDQVDPAALTTNCDQPAGVDMIFVTN